ncbi:hypothetical protein DS2_12779 [Catenovulum agarivorans DS-2]|uniref:Capsular polysaccharide synthesis enzyme CpsB n=1 Tax=Catenovulum agarivorans DS-2 TaxID=1328313 RepID=W7QVU5_9ALTE|nr:outer membrane beta-barrel protein [Catenovulum agarivorans]EWH09410.1 hypothetical protein DS2_12779 [Catenovulum agarivorans DS-2]
MHKTVKPIATAYLMLTSYSSHAQQQPIRLAEGVELIPAVTINYRHDNNIYYAESNRETGSVLQTTPQLKLTIHNENYTSQIDYVGKYGHYLNIQEPDYYDQGLAAKLSNSAHSKHNVQIGAKIVQGHQPRGTGLTEFDANITSRAIKFNQYQIDSRYEYGSQGAKGKLAIGINLSQLDYGNFKQLTKNNEYAKYRVFSEFDYKIGKVTALSIDLNQTKIVYKHSDSNLASRDSTESRLLVGAKWSGKSHLTGQIKFGFQNKTFDAATRANFNGLAVDINLNWQATSYSEFKLTLGKATKESYSNGDYIAESSTELAWEHAWSAFFKSQIQVGYSNEDYVGLDRIDHSRHVKLGLSYLPTKTIRLTASNQIDVKDSTLNQIEYNKNIFSVTLEVLL